MTGFWDMDDEGPIFGEDLVAETVNLYPEVVPFLQSVGMHCIGCAAAQGETLYEACRAHGLSGARVVRELNRIVTEG